MLYLLGHRQLRHARPGPLARLARFLFPLCIAFLIVYGVLQGLVGSLAETTTSGPGTRHIDGSTPVVVFGSPRATTCQFGDDQRFVAGSDSNSYFLTDGHYLRADGAPKSIRCDGPATFVESPLVDLLVPYSYLLVAVSVLLAGVTRVTGWSSQIIPRHVGPSATDDQAHRLRA